MNKRLFAILPSVVILAAGLLVTSCEKEADELDDDSHNAGMNCMTCHKSGGSGEGRFTVAGTLYDANNSVLVGATVKLFENSGGSGTPVVTLNSDEKGNFFTTSSIDFGTGLYARVISGSKTVAMITPLTTGECNSCHSEGNRIIVQ